jgi:hypothetical protein
MNRLAAAPAALALIAGLAACDPPRTSPPPPEATSAQDTAPRGTSTPNAKAQADTTGPLTFKQSDPAAEVALTLPAKISPYPALRAKLYDREVALLKAFAATAEADRKATAGQFPWRQYASQRQWFLTTVTPSLLGLRGMWYDYTGGAHPNHGAATLLWDTQKSAEIQPAALFRPGADMTVLDKSICEAVDAAKRKRGGVPFDAMFSCPKWTETTLVLTPSTLSGKVGGLTVLIDPYVVGPYAEGDYEITIPLSAFQTLLAPNHAEAFAGSPKSSGNPEGWPTTRMDVK